MRSSLDSILGRLAALPLRDNGTPDINLAAQFAAERLPSVVGVRIADTLKAMQPTPMTQAAADWDISSAWNLFLFGGVGCGKSVAAGWLASRCMMRGGSVDWVRGPEGAMWSVYGSDARQQAKRSRDSALLVLDDLGAELLSPGWLGWLEDVLGDRHADKARTVITSNLNPAAFRARYGDRLSDRLLEGVVFGTNAPSMRKAGGL